MQRRYIVVTLDSAGKWSEVAQFQTRRSALNEAHERRTSGRDILTEVWTCDHVVSFKPLGVPDPRDVQ